MAAIVGKWQNSPNVSGLLKLIKKRGFKEDEGDFNEDIRHVRAKAWKTRKRRYGKSGRKRGFFKG